ncbi:MAG: TetR family transcriptional regulator [Actinomycetia bacterium]|nr:TetR family transcriptional regulator [Actinomycetes bacterium]
MRSISDNPEPQESVDDRTTKARIRDAAIASIAEHGISGTTARKVASAAGVSPGLVIHHFGSMEGLRTACDQYVSGAIREFKERTMTGGPTLDVLAALRDSPNGPLMGYLAQVLADDSPAVAKLVDDLVDDAEGYIQQGVESGMLKPSDDPRGRAVVLTVWSLGALALHQHLRRLLGTDLTDPEILTDPAAAAYIAPVYEIYGKGILEEAFAARARAAFTESEGTT